MTVDKLMTLDMAFCEAVSKKGAQAWANHFADEGIMLTKTGDNIVSEPEIYKRMAPFFKGKGNTLIWSPEGGGISDAGDLGYTYGKYIRKLSDEQGKAVHETGRYLTIWRHMGEGTYKVELDMGN